MVNKRKKYHKTHYQRNKEYYKAQHKAYYSANRDKVLAKGREWRKNNPEKIKKYRQKAKKLSKKRLAKYAKSPSGIYTMLKCSAKTRRIKFKIERKDFIEWYGKQAKKCYYCGRSLEEITKDGEKYWGKRILRFSIDRVDNDDIYTLSNIVLCCPLCNGIKSNFFSEEEMIKIGKIVKKIIKERR